MRAARWTGSRRSRCSRAWDWWWRMPCWAAPGDHEDAGQPAGARGAPHAHAGVAAAGRDRHHQPVDTLCRSGHRRALVRAAATVLVFARAAAGTGRGLAAAARRAAGAADGAFPADPGAGLSRLQRPGHQRVAQHYPAVGIDMGGVFTAAKPGFYPGGGAVHHPRYPDVYGVVILCVSWQSPPGRWLSLMTRLKQGQQSWCKRLAWLAGIWLASRTRWPSSAAANSTTASTARCRCSRFA